MGKHKVEQTSSYGAMMGGALKDMGPAWEVFFKQKINPDCTAAADLATKKVYPSYEAGGKMTNTMTRTWYQAYMKAYEQQIKVTSKETATMSLEDRAHIAFAARHHARLQTREQMADRMVVAGLEARDLQKYGNKDGPTFDSLFKKNTDQGMSPDDSYNAIIASSLTTNKLVNAYVAAVKTGEAAYNFASKLLSDVANFVVEKASIDVGDNLLQDVTKDDIDLSGPPESRELNI